MGAEILVAEDQADIRDLIALNLRNAGYDVTPWPMAAPRWPARATAAATC